MISQTDLLLYAKAQNALNQAQLILGFVSTHLTETYSLSKEDSVNFQTGEITRGGGVQ